MLRVIKLKDENKKMRAFIAVDLPKEAREEIVRIQEKMPEFLGKKTEEENLHLTLKFLGEIDEEQVEKIKRELEKIKFNKFESEIDSIGIFNPNFIKIIWLHLTNCDKLQEEIDNKLKGLFPEEERFMSHLTIARVKNIKDKKEFMEKLREIKIPGVRFMVESFKLKKSVLTSEKPVYEDILEIKLI